MASWRGAAEGGDAGMTMNIDHWKTKELKDLRISIDALMECEDIKEPTVNPRTSAMVFVGLSEGFELRGKQAGDYLIVSHIEHWGVASGRNFDDLKALLEESTGALVAILTWESGDSERLIVRDGNVTQEAVRV